MRELAISELEIVSGGDWSWVDFFSGTLGAFVGGAAGAAVCTWMSGPGVAITVPAAAVGGAVSFAVGYVVAQTAESFIEWTQAELNEMQAQITNYLNYWYQQQVWGCP